MGAIKQLIRRIFSYRLVIALALSTVLTGVAFYERDVFDAVPAWSLELMRFACLFVPGALLRRRWRQASVLMALGAATYGVMRLLDALEFQPPRLLNWVAYTAMLFAAVALAEWWCTARGNRSALCWMLAGSLSAAAAYALVQYPLEYADSFFFRFPSIRFSGAWLERSLSSLTFWLLPSLLLWVTIPLGERAARIQSHRGQLALGTALLAPLVAHFVFFGHAIYELAGRSLVDAHPFPRNTGAALLAFRGRDEDYEFILTQLRRPDWEEIKHFDPMLEQESVDEHWHEACVEALSKRDRAWAAEQLATMLREHLNERLLKASLSLFVAERRYDLAPMIARSALQTATRWIEFSPDPDTNAFRDALEEMGVPQAAGVWLVDAADERIGQYTLALAADKVPSPDILLSVGPRYTKKLNQLLGANPSDRFEEWAVRYDEHVREAGSPLTGEQRREIDQLIHEHFEQLRHRAAELQPGVQPAT